MALRRRSTACSRRLTEDLPPCGGLVIQIAGSLPPVLKVLVVDNEEIEGDIKQANEALMPRVYRELRRIAGHCMQNEQAGRTIQTTALVHEAAGTKGQGIGELGRVQPVHVADSVGFK